MSDTKPLQKDSPWIALHRNTAELIRLWKAAHESVLGLHWKKIPPFSWIWPQVDLIRIQRMMVTLEEHCQVQIQTCQKLTKTAQTEKNPGHAAYYEATIPYLNVLILCGRLLSQIAATKQDKLEKKKISISEFHQTLRTYEKEVHELKRLAQPAMQAWNAIPLD